MVDLPITKWIKKKIRRLIGIVEDTDVATHSIASGKYVVWKGDLYKSTAAIAVGGSLSLSNLSPVSDGGLNQLSEQIGTVDNKIAEKISYPTYNSTTSIGVTTGTNSYQLTVDGWYRAWFTQIDANHYVEINGKTFGQYEPGIFFPAKAGTICILHGTASYGSYLDRYT